MPCAGHSTICARRHVTTDPDPRRTIRFRRLPSSSLISRTRTRPAIPASVTRSTSTGNPGTPGLARGNRANVGSYGTRDLRQSLVLAGAPLRVGARHAPALRCDHSGTIRDRAAAGASALFRLPGKTADHDPLTCVDGAGHQRAGEVQRQLACRVAEPTVECAAGRGDGAAMPFRPRGEGCERFAELAGDGVRRYST